MRAFAIVCTLLLSAGLAMGQNNIGQNDRVQNSTNQVDSLAGTDAVACGHSGPRLVTTPAVSLYNTATASIARVNSASGPQVRVGDDGSDTASQNAPGKRGTFDFGIARSQSFVGVATLMGRKPAEGKAVPRLFSNQDVEHLKQQDAATKSDAGKPVNQPNPMN